MERSLTELEQAAIANGISYLHGRYDYRMSRDDLRQIGAVRVLELRERTATVPEAERLKWLGWRVCNAIRDAMRRERALDGGTREAPQSRVMALEDRALDTPDLDTPEAQLVAMRAVQAIERMAEPLPTIASLSVAGCSGAEIAQTLHLSQARVSQLRSRLAALLAPHVSPTA